VPSKPKLKLPAGACDAHVHIFGPRQRFPFAEGRRYTPSDAPKAMLFALHEFLGIEHCVIVQPACHGLDNSVTVDAIAATGQAYRGISLLPVTVSDGELKRLDTAGICGARFHYMRHLAKGPSIDEVIAFGERLADIGWHLQIHMEAELIADLAPALNRSAVPVVIDHMGRVDASRGLEQPEFRALLALMQDDKFWER
jgi:2-pyrone-4,6-dicarboxylate lactonase